MSDTKNKTITQAFQAYAATDERGDLYCPNCGEPYLHHRVVNVYSRHEDGPSQLTSVTADGAVTVQPNVAGNPSARRDGVAIKFFCEQCGGGFALELAQHKGMSQLLWRELPKEEGEQLYNEWAGVDMHDEELRR